MESFRKKQDKMHGKIREKAKEGIRDIAKENKAKYKFAKEHFDKCFENI